MAWRPTQYLIEGVLQNVFEGRVVGWMRFAGIDEKVEFDLIGDFHRDIRGTIIHLKGEGNKADGQEAKRYFEGFNRIQKGQTGDITAGLPPKDYTDYPYIEWYGDTNGRVVIELNRDEIEVVGEAIDWTKSKPIDRQMENAKMMNFLQGIARSLGKK